MEIGQILYIQALNFRSTKKRTIQEVLDGLIEAKVETIGRKYFTVSGSNFIRTKFSLLTMSDVSELGDGRYFCAFEDKNHLALKLEKEELLREIKNFFCYKMNQNLDLDQLRKIKEVIGEISEDKF